MKTVAIKGNYELRYERRIDDFGFEKDYMELFDIKARIQIPFLPPLKVSNNTSSTPISNLGYEYTQQDFDITLDEQVKKLSTV